MQDEEDLIESVNTEFEKARKKKEECVQNLTKYNVDDRGINEQNTQLDDEIKNLQESLSAEYRKLEGEKTQYKQKLEQMSNNDRSVKKFEARISKVKQTIKTLEENIQSELSS